MPLLPEGVAPAGGEAHPLRHRKDQHALLRVRPPPGEPCQGILCDFLTRPMYEAGTVDLTVQPPAQGDPAPSLVVSSAPSESWNYSVALLGLW